MPPTALALIWHALTTKEAGLMSALSHASDINTVAGTGTGATMGEKLVNTGTGVAAAGSAALSALRKIPTTYMGAAKPLGWLARKSAPAWAASIGYQAIPTLMHPDQRTREIKSQLMDKNLFGRIAQGAGDPIGSIATGVRSAWDAGSAVMGLARDSLRPSSVRR